MSRNAVLISIRPEWCQKIANGEKTIEIRKSHPKLDAPFKVYVYCTMGGIKKMPKEYLAENFERGKVVGEFICSDIGVYEFEYCPHPEIEGIGDYADSWYGICDEELKQTGLSEIDFTMYGEGDTLYGWYISDLHIYDTPRELSEFTGLRETRFGAEPVPITRPPQSWCYVEELK